MEHEQTSPEDNSVIGKRALVTGKIGPNFTGEVQLSIRGGIDRFLAHPDPDWASEEIFPINSRVIVTDFFPPKTVFVKKALPAAL